MSVSCRFENASGLTFIPHKSRVYKQQKQQYEICSRANVAGRIR